MIKLVGIDPGLTTGVFECWIAEDKLISPLMYEVMYPNIDHLYALADENLYIICEDFIINKSAIGSRGEALKVIGVLETFYTVNTTIILQQPSQKQRMPTSRLRTIFKKHHITWHPSLHIQDAARHVMIYLSMQSDLRSIIL